MTHEGYTKIIIETKYPTIGLVRTEKFIDSWELNIPEMHDLFVDAMKGHQFSPDAVDRFYEALDEE